jgi:HTH-type transcriptional regulator, sugar sensing transcriptional regulator
MPIHKNTLNSLKILGLNDYESKAYAALTSLITGTATEISQASNVPRSKVYEILKNLDDKGFIETIRGKPLRFSVVPPQDIFEKSKKQMKEKLDQAEAELNMIYEEQIPNVPAPIWIIYGPEKIVKKEIEIISRAKNTLHIAAGFMFQKEAEKLKKSLENVHKIGVHSRIIAAPYCITDGEKIDISQVIDDIESEIEIVKIPYIKVVIRDKKEMLLIFCRFSEENAISQTAIAVWNQYTEFVETIAEVYNVIWTMELFNISPNSE